MTNVNDFPKEHFFDTLTLIEAGEIEKIIELNIENNDFE